ncbi:MAG TPA: hypothetical protein PLG47_06380, partial [Candidatus Dojkabacteria bacterium]|nr:hypothetical protein [Candidatus Dojkabacteria bacterium]
YPPGSNTPGTPTAPVVYINNSSVLATIAVNTTGLATQVTLAALLTELQLKADLTETQPVSAASLPLPTGAATETTQAANNVLLGTIDADTSSLATPTTGLAVSMLRVTGAGAASVAAGKRRVSFFNAGNADSTVAGATLKKGEIVSFSADGLRDTLAAISYDALTSELLITTVG